MAIGAADRSDQISVIFAETWNELGVDAAPTSSALHCCWLYSEISLVTLSATYSNGQICQGRCDWKVASSTRLSSGQSPSLEICQLHAKLATSVHESRMLICMEDGLQASQEVLLEYARLFSI